MTGEDLRPSTLAVHGKTHPRQVRDPVVRPVFQSTTFVNPIASTCDLWYTRYGNNPNQTYVGERLAALERCEAAIFLASGMGATALAHLSVLSSGDHLLSSSYIYGGTERLLREELPRFGIEVSFFDPFEEAPQFRSNTKAVFVEAVTNPVMRVVDLEPIAGAARSHDARLIVDSTFATPINLNPVDLGADLVIHSATKYLNGHTDVIAGAVAGPTEQIERIQQLLHVWGPAIDPHAAWLIERGMKTLAIRVACQNANAARFAEWASRHEGFSKVHYPGLPDHPDHELAQRILRGYGGMVGLELAAGAEAAGPMLERLQIATHAPSLGGTETLVSEPRFTSHASLSPAARAAQGIPDGFLRVSVGIEAVEDLIADFEQALQLD